MSFHRHVKTSRVQAGSWNLWLKNVHADTLALDHLLGELPVELPFELPGGSMWRSNGNSFNFTFAQVMMDFRKQVLERSFDPDMPNHPMGKKMMQPVVPKLMCAISEGTRRCECSNEYDFKDEGIGFCF